jgi:deazaflavin-dependent oxidoreductase (nitroreductase family)
MLVAAGPLLLRFRPRWAASFNLLVTNRITGLFANRLPMFGILIHQGRTSGKTYRTPVNVFKTPDGFAIALTYGRECQWVRNVLAAGAAQLETRGKLYRISSPLILHDNGRRRFPLPVRVIQRILGAEDLMAISAQGEGLIQSRSFSRGSLA